MVNFCESFMAFEKKVYLYDGVQRSIYTSEYIPEITSTLLVMLFRTSSYILNFVCSLVQYSLERSVLNITTILSFCVFLSVSLVVSTL